MNESVWKTVQTQNGVGTFPLIIQCKILSFKTDKFTEAAIVLSSVLSLTLTQSTPAFNFTLSQPYSTGSKAHEPLLLGWVCTSYMLVVLLRLPLQSNLKTKKLKESETSQRQTILGVGTPLT